MRSYFQMALDGFDWGGFVSISYSVCDCAPPLHEKPCGLFMGRFGELSPSDEGGGFCGNGSRILLLRTTLSSR